MLAGGLGQVELLEDLGDVGFHRSLGYEQPPGDGLVRHPFGDQREDFALTVRELASGSSFR